MRSAQPLRPPRAPRFAVDHASGAAEMRGVEADPDEMAEQFRQFAAIALRKARLQQRADIGLEVTDCLGGPSLCGYSRACRSTTQYDGPSSDAIGASLKERWVAAIPDANRHRLNTGGRWIRTNGTAARKASAVRLREGVMHRSDCTSCHTGPCGARVNRAGEAGCMHETVIRAPVPRLSWVISDR